MPRLKDGIWDWRSDDEIVYLVSEEGEDEEEYDEDEEE